MVVEACLLQKLQGRASVSVRQLEDVSLQEEHIKAIVKAIPPLHDCRGIWICQVTGGNPGVVLSTQVCEQTAKKKTCRMLAAE